MRRVGGLALAVLLALALSVGVGGDEADAATANGARDGDATHARGTDAPIGWTDDDAHTHHHQWRGVPKDHYVPDFQPDALPDDHPLIVSHRRWWRDAIEHAFSRHHHTSPAEWTRSHPEGRRRILQSGLWPSDWPINPATRNYSGYNYPGGEGPDDRPYVLPMAYQPPPSPPPPPPSPPPLPPHPPPSAPFPPSPPPAPPPAPPPIYPVSRSRAWRPYPNSTLVDMYMGYAGVGPIFFAVDRYYYSTNRTDVGGAESFETRYDGNNIRPSTLMGPGHTKHRQLHVPVNLTTVYVRICDDSGYPLSVIQNVTIEPGSHLASAFGRGNSKEVTAKTLWELVSAMRDDTVSKIKVIAHIGLGGARLPTISGNRDLTIVGECANPEGPAGVPFNVTKLNNTGFTPAYNVTDGFSRLPLKPPYNWSLSATWNGTPVENQTNVGEHNVHDPPHPVYPYDDHPDLHQMAGHGGTGRRLLQELDGYGLNERPHMSRGRRRLRFSHTSSAGEYGGSRDGIDTSDILDRELYTGTYGDVYAGSFGDVGTDEGVAFLLAAIEVMSQLGDDANVTLDGITGGTGSSNTLEDGLNETSYPWEQDAWTTWTEEAFFVRGRAFDSPTPLEYYEAGTTHAIGGPVIVAGGPALNLTWNRYYVPNVTAGNLTHACTNETWVNETTICFNFSRADYFEACGDGYGWNASADGTPGFVTRYYEPNVTYHPHWSSAEITSLNLSSATNVSEEVGVYVNGSYTTQTRWTTVVHSKDDGSGIHVFCHNETLRDGVLVNGTLVNNTWNGTIFNGTYNGTELQYKFNRTLSEPYQEVCFNLSRTYINQTCVPTGGRYNATTNTTFFRMIETFYVPLKNRCVIDGLEHSAMFSVGDTSQPDCAPFAARPVRFKPGFGGAKPVVVNVSDSSQTVFVPPHLSHRFDYDGWSGPNASAEGFARSPPRRRKLGAVSGPRGDPREPGVDVFAGIPDTVVGAWSPWGNTEVTERSVSNARARRCGRLELNNLVLRRGWSEDDAGAVATVSGGELQVRGSVVEFSRTGPNAGRGGAVVNYRGDVRISRSTFRGNVAARGLNASVSGGTDGGVVGKGDHLYHHGGTNNDPGSLWVDYDTTFDGKPHAVNQASSDQSI